MIPDEAYNKLMNIKREVVESCSRCDGTGYLPEPDENGDNYCECMVRFEWIVQLVTAAIPYAYWHLSMKDLVVDSSYKKLSKYFIRNLGSAVEKSMGILFWGTNGVGKTSLMCEVGKWALAAGYKVRYVTVQKYVNSVMKDPEYVDWAMDSDLLLLDELDKVYMKRGSSYVSRTLEELLRRALSGGRALIMCTNWSEEEIKSNFGNSTVSLLRRQLKFVHIDGEDYSQNLQDSWEEKLEEQEHYSGENLDKMAYKYHDVVLEDQFGE